MAAVVAAALVVVGGHLLCHRQLRIGQELCESAFRALGFGGGEFPRRPIGTEGLTVEGEDVAGVADDALRHAPQGSGLFERRACGGLCCRRKCGADLRRCEESQQREAGEKSVFHWVELVRVDEFTKTPRCCLN